MLAFLGGIVLTNLLGANRQIHGQLLNQTFLQQYAYQKVDGNQLFGHVVMVRMQMLVLIFLLGRAVDGKVFSVLAKSMLSAGFGFLLVVGIMEYGGYGCLIILAGLLPQWIFYTAALLFYANSKKRQSRIVGWNSWQDRTRQLAEAGLVTGCVLLGTFVESFVNPAVSTVLKHKIFKMITIYGTEKIRKRDVVVVCLNIIREKCDCFSVWF